MWLAARVRLHKRDYLRATKKKPQEQHMYTAKESQYMDAHGSVKFRRHVQYLCAASTYPEQRAEEGGEWKVGQPFTPKRWQIVL